MKDLDLFLIMFGIAFCVGVATGYIFWGLHPAEPTGGHCSEEEANQLLKQGVSDGEWRMANRPCGYPGLEYGYPGHHDPYSDMCTITETQWYELNNHTWVRNGLPE